MHASNPYTNSTVVNPDKKIQQLLIPAYINTPKAVLFVSGHSHNLEYFNEQDKNFIVIGGGGGLYQSVKIGGKQAYNNLVPSEINIRYFYLLVERKNNTLSINVKGFNADNLSKTIENQLLTTTLAD